MGIRPDGGRNRSPGGLRIIRRNLRSASMTRVLRGWRRRGGLGGLESVKKTQQVARDGLGAIWAGPLPARMWYCRIPGEIRVRQATYPFFCYYGARATR